MANCHAYPVVAFDASTMENVPPTRTLMTFEGSVKPYPGEADAEGAAAVGDAEAAGEGAGDAISPIEISAA